MTLPARTLSIDASTMVGPDRAAGAQWRIAPFALDDERLPVSSDAEIALLTAGEGVLDADGAATVQVAVSPKGSGYRLWIGSELAGHFVMPDRNAEAGALIEAAAPIVPLPQHQGPQGKYEIYAFRAVNDGAARPAAPTVQYDPATDTVTLSAGWSLLPSSTAGMTLWAVLVVGLDPARTAAYTPQVSPVFELGGHTVVPTPTGGQLPEPSAAIARRIAQVNGAGTEWQAVELIANLITDLANWLDNEGRPALPKVTAQVAEQILRVNADGDAYELTALTASLVGGLAGWLSANGYPTASETETAIEGLVEAWAFKLNKTLIPLAKRWDRTGHVELMTAHGGVNRYDPVVYRTDESGAAMVQTVAQTRSPDAIALGDAADGAPVEVAGTWVLDALPVHKATNSEPTVTPAPVYWSATSRQAGRTATRWTLDVASSGDGIIYGYAWHITNDIIAGGQSRSAVVSWKPHYSGHSDSHYTPNSIPGDAIEDGTLDLGSKVTGELPGDAIADGSVDLASKVTGELPAKSIGDEIITARMLHDAAVTGSKLAKDSVTAATIKDGEISYPKLSDGLQAQVDNSALLAQAFHEAGEIDYEPVDNSDLAAFAVQPANTHVSTVRQAAALTYSLDPFTLTDGRGRTIYVRIATDRIAEAIAFRWTQGTTTVRYRLLDSDSPPGVSAPHDYGSVGTGAASHRYIRFNLGGSVRADSGGLDSADAAIEYLGHIRADSVTDREIAPGAVGYAELDDAIESVVDSFGALQPSFARDGNISWTDVADTSAQWAADNDYGPIGLTTAQGLTYGHAEMVRAQQGATDGARWYIRLPRSGRDATAFRVHVTFADDVPGVWPLGGARQAWQNLTEHVGNDSMYDYWLMQFAIRTVTKAGGVQVANAQEQWLGDITKRAVEEALGYDPAHTSHIKTLGPDSIGYWSMDVGSNGRWGIDSNTGTQHFALPSTWQQFAQFTSHANFVSDNEGPGFNLYATNSESGVQFGARRLQVQLRAQAPDGSDLGFAGYGDLPLPTDGFGESATSGHNVQFDGTWGTSGKLAGTIRVDVQQRGHRIRFQVSYASGSTSSPLTSLAGQSIRLAAYLTLEYSTPSAVS